MVEKIKKPTGVIFPINPKNVKRIFNGSNIVCKYVGQNFRSIKIEKGINFYIYETSPKSEISTKAIIDKIEFLDISELLNKYKENRLFAPVSDLQEYSKNRKKQKMVVLTLKNLKRHVKSPILLLNPGISHQYIYK